MNKWFVGASGDLPYLPATVPQVMNSNSGSFTVGTVYFVRQKVQQGTTISGCQFLVSTYTSQADVYIGIYTYASSGAVTKISSGSTTVTATGEKTITFPSPVALTKGTDVSVALLLASGNIVILARSSALASTLIQWSGATSQANLPASDNTSRSTYTTIPGIEWIIA